MTDLPLLKMISPINVATAGFTCNLPETDYATWSSGTTYVVGNRVISLTTHSVYEAVVGSTNVNPDTDTTGKWAKVGATNIWKPFDGKISDHCTTNGGLIQFTINTPNTLDSVAIFGLFGASVRLYVTRNDPGVGYTVLSDETVSLVDNSAIVDAWTYVSYPVVTRSEMIFDNLPCYAGGDVRIEITAGTLVEVGEIVVGTAIQIGKATTGGSVGITDYSKKDRDTYGNAIIVKRAFSDWAEFRLSLPSASVSFIKRTLADRRSTPTVFHQGREYIDFGQTIFGFYADLSVEIASNPESTLSLRVEGLI